jgi:hypothetical protein
MKRTFNSVLAVAILLIPSVALAANIKPGQTATVRCEKCVTTPEDCVSFMPPPCIALTAESCAPLCPVVEQTPCPAATVLPQPVLLIDPVGDAGIDPDNPAPHLVGPAVQKKKLKEWQKWTIGIVGGVIVGMIAQHQFDDHDDRTGSTGGGSQPSDGCDAHGHGNGTGCHRGD